ncbi:hypothetical protein [Achromobacter insuavis]|uniref:hypothetical protein n=1 Tax=Achromobacter insuavis TaxID=1287735 RepID=UPI001F12F57E|nr:hypothetical protein [Achromobacter insuavis]
MLAGWAAGLSCAFHVLAACLLWRAASEREAPPTTASIRQDDFFVTLLPPVPAPRPSTSSATSAVAPPPIAPPSPASAESAKPSSPVLPKSSAPPPSEPAKPSAPLQAPPAKTPAANAPAANAPAVARPPPAAAGAASPAAPPRDFRWRDEDAAAQGLPRARGEARVGLAPKTRAEPSALAKGIAQSARPPCRDAHAHLGLLALPFLLSDTVRDDGCKW